MSNTKTSGSRLTPQFWQSPFSIAAATMVTSQIIIYSTALVDGRALAFELLWPLTIATVLVMAAGLWPEWNYVEIGDEHLAQHAGLTCFCVPWSAVKTIKPGLSGVDVQYVDEDPQGTRKLTRARVFNRYGLPVSELHTMIDTAWQKNTAHTFG